MVKIIAEPTEHRFGFQPKPASTERAQKKLDYSNARSAANSAALAEIGELPAVADPGRRFDCGLSLLSFLTTYFPYSTGLSPFGAAQLAAIERIEAAIFHNAWVANILPRGFVKSTISENATIWALLYGYRKYVMFFASSAALSETAIGSIKTELTTNPLLIEDFPEACVPLIRLGGKTMRTFSQTYRGELTNIEFSKDALRLATIPGFAGSAGIVQGFGLLAPPRGARFKDSLGRNVRPDLAVADDPSSDASAVSPVQNATRLNILKSSVSMMGGHGKPVSLIVNATVIAEGDLASTISDPDKSPEWQAVRSAMITSMPVALDSMWLGKYADLRRKYDRDDPMGRVKARAKSTAFYEANREMMDAGGSVAWPAIGLDPGEVSALQHGINILVDKGELTFAAECQNQPLKPKSISTLELTEELADKTNGMGRYVVPKGLAYLTFGIDVHDTVLYYTVMAMSADMSVGAIVDYGCYPPQNKKVFSLASAKQTLQDHYGTSTTEEAIALGVEDLVSQIQGQAYINDVGQEVGISLGCIDRGYKAPEVYNALTHLLPLSANVITTKGTAVNLTKKPFSEYDLSVKRVVRSGPTPEDVRWIFARDRVYASGRLFDAIFDSNHFKSLLASRLAGNGGIELYSGNDHDFYISHFLSETPMVISGDGRSVCVWNSNRLRDNHYFDTAVLCVVAASMAGGRVPALAPAPMPVVPRPPKAVRPTVDDLLPSRGDYGNFFDRENY